MPTTKEGVQRLLEFFLYGMLRGAETFGNGTLFLRTVEEQGLRKFMLIDMPAFQASDDPVATCRAYTEEVDRAGLFDGSDTTFREDDGTVVAEFGNRCIYRQVCSMRHDEELPVHCIRAVALVEMLRIRLGRDFRWKLGAFARSCRVTLRETALPAST